MNFSSEWRTPFAIAATIAAPSLHQTPTTLGPLLFHPDSPSHVLLSSPTLPLPLPSPPPSAPSDLLAFLRGALEGDFFGEEMRERLVEELVEVAGEERGFNGIGIVRWGKKGVVVVFPVGENADWIGFVGVERSGLGGFQRKSCDFGSKSKELETERCEFGSKRKQLETENCGFGSKEVESEAERCDFGSKRVRFEGKSGGFGIKDVEFEAERFDIGSEEIVLEGKRLDFEEEGNDIGKVGVLFEGGRCDFVPKLVTNCDGDVFVQRTGFRHKRHRITGIAVVASEEEEEECGVIGYVLATTMYSVNWFRLEIGDFDVKSERKRPLMVPVAKNGFEICVAHACWNPHFPEESVVLLENGELVCVDVGGKKGNRVEVLVGGEFGGGWFKCEFSVQPWILIVAGSEVVLMVDLEASNGGKPTVLAKVDCCDTYDAVRPLKSNRFLAFCVAEFDRFYFTVVTDFYLLLFDKRDPMVPLLVWDHGISHPCYVAMHRLSELRHLKAFSWASDSGYAILLGSFREDKFKLFCYGPTIEGGLGVSRRPIWHAWDLPSSVSVSCRGYGSADSFLREEYSKSESHDGAQNNLMKELVLGFCILPKDSSEVGGFDLIRLMSSGRLEFQRYRASWDHSYRKPVVEENAFSVCQAPDAHTWDDEGATNNKLRFLKFRFLLAYMNDELLESLSTELDKPQLSYAEFKEIACKRDLWERIKNKTMSTTNLISDAISDTSFPTSIHEIAFRRVLASLSPTLLYLAFSTYNEIFGRGREFSLELLEHPPLLTNKRLPPFLLGKPSERAERWSQKTPRGDNLVGPVIPLPVLLTLQQIEGGMAARRVLADEEENLLKEQYNVVYKNIFPEISLADDSYLNSWTSSEKEKNEKPYFIYEGCSNVVDKGPTFGEPKDHTGPAFAAQTTSKDPNFTTFVYGNKLHKDSRHAGASGVQTFDDLMAMNLDFDLPELTFTEDEAKVYKSLSKQFLNWQANYKPYQDFCTSAKPE